MPRMVKKTIVLNQDYIDTARLIFGIRTEKEAVNKALEMAVIDNRVIEAHESVGGKGDLIEDSFRSPSYVQEPFEKSGLSKLLYPNNQLASTIKHFHREPAPKLLF